MEHQNISTAHAHIAFPQFLLLAGRIRNWTYWTGLDNNYIRDRKCSLVLVNNMKYMHNAAPITSIPMQISNDKNVKHLIRCKQGNKECFITTHVTDIAFQNLHVYDEKRKLLLLVLENQHNNVMGNKI